jgi:hypothetical protein
VRVKHVRIAAWKLIQNVTNFGTPRTALSFLVKKVVVDRMTLCKIKKKKLKVSTRTKTQNYNPACRSL